MNHEVNTYMIVTDAVYACLNILDKRGDLPPVHELHSSICDALERFQDQMSEMQRMKHSALAERSK